MLWIVLGETTGTSGPDAYALSEKLGIAVTRDRARSINGIIDIQSPKNRGILVSLELGLNMIIPVHLL